MKNLTLTILATAMLFAGCSKEVEEQSPTGVSPKLASQQPIEFSTQTLAFASMNELEATVADLEKLSHQERKDWLTTHSGFMSMSESAMQVNDQMSKCQSLEDVFALKKAYNDIFIFNPSTIIPVNAAPYLKLSKTEYKWICNAYGDVEIAGQIVNLNDIKTYDQTWRGKAERESILVKSPQTRSLNMLMLTNSSTGHSVLVTIKYIYTSPVHAYMNLESGKLINSKWWVYAEDFITVAIIANRTDGYAFDQYSPTFLQLHFNNVNKRIKIKIENGVQNDILIGYTYGYSIPLTEYRITADKIPEQYGYIGINL